ncbi:MAG: triose-phosphate isomerase [Gammaproteobacteria bacterium]
MRRPLVAANWKMHGRLAMMDEYVGGLGDGGAGVELVLCPPAPYLFGMATAIEGLKDVSLGAQDCSTENDDGAYTGEVSANMLADVGCRWVIVGHSERRRRCGESDALVAGKFAAAQAAGLAPILCVGETAEERRAGRAQATVLAQVEAVMEQVGADGFSCALIAYEPVWAIGSGESATPEVAQEMHGFLRETISRSDARVGEAVRILYGGSVNAGNAGALFAQSDIDGALVGGASLDPKNLLAIAAAVAVRMN